MLQNLIWEGADIYKSDKDYILHFTMKMPETTLTRIFLLIMLQINVVKSVLQSLSWTSPVIVEYDTLTHWGQVTHICVGNLTIIGSDNGLSPSRCQAITWTKVGILLIGPLGTNFSEMLMEIHTFSLKKIHLKMSSGKRRPFCLGLNVLILHVRLSPVSLAYSISYWQQTSE